MAEAELLKKDKGWTDLLPVQVASDALLDGSTVGSMPAVVDVGKLLGAS